MYSEGSMDQCGRCGMELFPEQVQIGECPHCGYVFWDKEGYDEDSEREDDMEEVLESIREFRDGKMGYLPDGSGTYGGMW